MDKSAADFWEWFEQNHTVIEGVINGHQLDKRNAIIEALDQHILSFGRIKWVIDQPDDRSFQFILSPNRDPELWQITQEVIRQAPNIIGWRFLDALPANGNLQIEIYDDYMDTHTIDAHDWQPYVRKLSSGQWLFQLPQTANKTDLDPENFMVAVHIALTNVLGEHGLMEQVNKVEVKPVEAMDQKSKRIPMPEIKTLFT